MDIELLQKQYKLSQKAHDEIYELIKKAVIGNRKPSGKICNMIIGQNGSGKSTFSKKLQTEDDTLVVINGDYIRGFHPYAEELMNLYPKDYCYILFNDWTLWKNRLLQDIIFEGYSFNFEATLKDPSGAITLIETLKANGYTFHFYIIALNYVESRLRVLERFFKTFSQTRTGRIIDADYQSKAFNNITDFIDSINLLEAKSIVILDYNFIPYSICGGSEQKKMILDLIRRMYEPMITEGFADRFKNIQMFYDIFENELEKNIKQRCLEQMRELEVYLNSLTIEAELQKRLYYKK